MQRYLKSWWVRVGLALLVLGTGPFVAFMTSAKLGLWPDPNPNPVYLGVLVFLTFQPSLVLIAIGVWRVRAKGQGGEAGSA